MNKKDKAISLFEIQENLEACYLELENYCEANKTDTPPLEMLEELDIAQEKHQQKIGNYILYLKTLQSDYQYYKDLQGMASKKMKSIKKRSSWAIKVVEAAIISYGQVNEKGTYSIDLDLAKASLVPSVSTVIKDIEKIPRQYIEVKEVETIDTKRVKKALLAGEILEGAELKENLSLRFGNVTLKV